MSSVFGRKTDVFDVFRHTHTTLLGHMLQSALPAHRPARTRSASRPATACASPPASQEEAFCVRHFRQWTPTPDEARKCLSFLRERERRVFVLERAAAVVASLREDHEARYPLHLPAAERPEWEAPKTWPGFLLVLQRCSTAL